jgi:hypothetical protein
MADPRLEPTTYREYQVALTPRYTGEWGEAWAGALGTVKDGVRAGVIAATKARLISVGPDDALPYKAWERGLERGPNESATPFRARLKAFPKRAKYFGTDKGIVDALADMGLTAVVVSGRSWGEHPAKMWVVITDHPWTYTGTWAAEDMLDNTTRGYGSDATLDEIKRVQRIVKKWKGSHTHHVATIVVLEPDIYGYPFWTWNERALLNGPLTGKAVYWDGD